MTAPLGEPPDDDRDDVVEEVTQSVPITGIGLRYQVRRHRTHEDVWFVYDAARERVVDVVHGPTAEQVITMRTSALNNHTPEPPEDT